ncbi:MAG: sigma-70 family RNA polymerase sigma factor [Acidobacteria bacterium]|nr:sigma-70 family RNA polymerase sigma factor [Acidobacteriota bacterium]
MAGDAELIARALGGDGEAFDALIGSRWERMFRIAWRIVGDAEDARDVAQQSCLRLWETLGRFRIGEDLDGWIYRMTVNLAIDALRRRQARPEEPWPAAPAEPVPAAGPGPEELLRARELDAALQEVTHDLPPRQKAVFVLARIEGLSGAEIAAMLGLAPSTVRNHLFQARAVVGRRLAEKFPGLFSEGAGGKGEAE